MLQHPQVTLPELNLGSALGWASPPRTPGVLSHNGGSRPPGTFAQITIIPHPGIGVAVLANAMTGAGLARAVTQMVLDDAGLHPSPPPESATRPTHACAGSYERGHARFTVTAVDDGTLDIEVGPGPLGDQDVKVGTSGRYTATTPPWFTGPGGHVAFIQPDTTKTMRYLHDGRVARRIA